MVRIEMVAHSSPVVRTMEPMSTQLIRDFRDLICWQQAIELSLACDKVADALPRKAWKTAQQLRDAAESVHLNIAEGNGRPTTADYLKSLGIADASLNEVQSNLYAVSRRFPRVEHTAESLELTVRVAKPLAGLIKSLTKKERGAGLTCVRSRPLIPIPCLHSRLLGCPPSPFPVPPSRSRCSVSETHLDLIVIEHRPMPHVRLPLRRRLVRVCAIRRQLPPPDAGRPHDALADGFLDARDGGEYAAIVVNRHAHARRDAATLGVRRMHHAFRRSRGALEWPDVHERRVQELVRG